MGALSQIVGESARPYCHSMYVAPSRAQWQIGGVDDSKNKNGGPNNLRAWREFREISQEELARLANTSANMIQYLETGERGLSLKWLRRLAPILGTTPGILADYAPIRMETEVHDFWAHKLTPEQRARLYKIIAEELAKDS